MPACLRQAVDRRCGGRPGRGDDAGFTLVEVVVSLLIISITMAGLTAFFIATVSAAGRHGGRQVGIQLAQDALEQVHALQPTVLLTGRTDCATSPATCHSPVQAAQPALAGIAAAHLWNAGTSPQLPFGPVTGLVDGVTYSRYWYVAECWRAPVASASCGDSATSGYVDLLRVVVAVTWADKRCTGGTCSYVDTTLVGQSTEPLFQPTQAAPSSSAGAQPSQLTVNNPGNQSGSLWSSVNLTLAASGGTPPITWTCTGLPPGLSCSSGGQVSGMLWSWGTFSVTVTARDSASRTGSASFTWTVW